VKRRSPAVIIVVLIVGLFAAGVIWRAANPAKEPGLNTEELQFDSRQHGYYLCLKLPVLTDAERRNLIRAKLPHDDQAFALRGCQEAQQR